MGTIKWTAEVDLRDLCRLRDAETELEILKAGWLVQLDYTDYNGFYTWYLFKTILVKPWNAVNRLKKQYDEEYAKLVRKIDEVTKENDKLKRKNTKTSKKKWFIF